MPRKPRALRGFLSRHDLGGSAMSRTSPRRGVVVLARLFAALVAMPDLGGPSLVAQAPSVSPREVFRRFWPYMHGRRRYLALTLLFVTVGPALDAAEIWLFKLVIDDVLVPHDFARFLPIAAAYLGLTLAGAVLGFLDDVVSAWLSQGFLLQLRTDVFRHVQNLSLEFFESRRLGDTMARVTGDVTAIETFLISGVTDAVSYVLRLVFFTGALFVLSWQLALVSLTVATLFWLAARQISHV